MREILDFDPTWLRVDTERQPFIDDMLIESAENLTRRWHRPEKHPDNPVIQPDKPWEHVTESTVNGFQVLYDSHDRLFKCWYMDTIFTGHGDTDGILGDSRYNMLYAQSEDGVQWEKPPCGEMIEGRQTNVILTDGYGLTCVIDPNEENDERRFKGLYTKFTQFGDVDSVVAVTSRDGIRWSEEREKPAFGRHGNHLDDVMVMSYDPDGRIYSIATRHYDMYAVARNLGNPTVGQFTPPHYPLSWAQMAKRRIWQADSADAVHWSEPYPILVPRDGAEGIDETYYGMSRLRISNNLCIGFVSVFSQVDNTLEVRLVYTRDGHTWAPLNQGQSFIRRGNEHDWDSNIVAMPAHPIEQGDSLLCFYGGAINHHDWWLVGTREGLDVDEARDRDLVRYAHGLSTLRRDGFASLEATVRPGILITRPVISSGQRLSINAACRSAGQIRAEVVDVRDHVIPGFSRSECDPFQGDSVDHLMTWNGNGLLPAVPTARAEYPDPETDRMRKIRFYLDKAELYEFHLEAE